MAAMQQRPMVIFACMAMLVGAWYHYIGNSLKLYNILGGVIVLISAFYVYRKYADVADARRIWKGGISFLTLFEIFFAIAAAVLLYCFTRQVFYDDASFILRYLDHFAKGHFYVYNAGDDPVFGISSFVYGLLAGMLAYTGIPPDTVLDLLGLAGITACVFLIIQICKIVIADKGWAFVVAIGILTSCKSFLEVAYSGMETPVHLSIVLAAFFFFLKSRERMMWFFLFLSVVSKLDAVPIVLVIAAIHFFHNRREISSHPLKSRTIGRALLWGALPVALWILVATWLFGSPLPQSAFAKIYYHGHPQDHWFPFLKHYTQIEQKRGFFLVLMILLPIHVLSALLSKDKRFHLRETVFGGAFFAILVLFYFYNPGEQMGWYYVIPDVLLNAQVLISTILLTPVVLEERYLRILFPFAMVAFFSHTWSDVQGGHKYMARYLNIVEKERLRIGDYVDSLTTEKDTVAGFHGHPVRKTSAYVLDMSGLNSKLVTDYKRNTDSLLHAFQPRLLINHAFDDLLSQMNKHGYHVRKAFYGITRYQAPTWLVAEYNPGDAVHTARIPLDHITAGQDPVTDYLNIGGQRIQINLTGFEYPRRLFVGVCREDIAFVLHFNFFSQQGTSGISRRLIPGQDAGAYPAYVTEDLILDIPDSTISIEISSQQSFRLIDPMVEFRRSLPPAVYGNTAAFLQP